MSLLLNGAKTATIAGTQLQMVEIYTGESYTFPLTFKNSAGTAINITGWTLATTAKYYTANITYPSGNSTIEDITLAGLTLITAPSPATFTTGITSGTAGTAWMYIPATANGGVTIGLDTSPSTICIVTLTITRPSSFATGTVSDINKEPIGLIIRYI
jgi:hypothetical protein